MNLCLQPKTCNTIIETFNTFKSDWDNGLIFEGYSTSTELSTHSIVWSYHYPNSSVITLTINCTSNLWSLQLNLPIFTITRLLASSETPDSFGENFSRIITDDLCHLINKDLLCIDTFDMQFIRILTSQDFSCNVQYPITESIFLDVTPLPVSTMYALSFNDSPLTLGLFVEGSLIFQDPYLILHNIKNDLAHLIANLFTNTHLTAAIPQPLDTLISISNDLVDITLEFMNKDVSYELPFYPHQFSCVTLDNTPCNFALFFTQENSIYCLNLQSFSKNYTLRIPLYSLDTDSIASINKSFLKESILQGTLNLFNDILYVSDNAFQLHSWIASSISCITPTAPITFNNYKLQISKDSSTIRLTHDHAILQFTSATSILDTLVNILLDLKNISLIQ